ncbi:MAG: hypothetical protein ACI4WW_00755 [Candidatus Coprovivens sp.]
MKKKQSKKTKQENKKIRISNIFLVIIVALIFIGGFLKTVIFSEDINDYENRTTYKYTKPTIKNITDKEFQDNIELVLSDQLPLSTTMKKKYNEFNSSMNYNIMKTFTRNNCENRYITMMPGVTTFDCDDVLVWGTSSLEHDKASLDLRIKNINNAIKSTKATVYVYYIEKDTDINFETNKKSNISNYVMENIKTNNTHIYKINSFEEFKRDFYKTDHHWNYEGSYRGYLELAELLDVENPIKHKEKRCIEKSYTGSKANTSGASKIYIEDFCAYDYDVPNHKVTVDGKESIYSRFSLQEGTPTTYGGYYGWDNAEIIFDYNQPKRENILLIGESYDNAIIELIGSHFNKTYSIDLRHYERTFGKKFNYTKYIKEHNIEKVILIGNIDYFTSETFNLEVE